MRCNTSPNFKGLAPARFRHQLRQQKSGLQEMLVFFVFHRDLRHRVHPDTELIRAFLQRFEKCFQLCHHAVQIPGDLLFRLNDWRLCETASHDASWPRSAAPLADALSLLPSAVGPIVALSLARIVFFNPSIKLRPRSAAPAENRTHEQECKVTREKHFSSGCCKFPHSSCKFVVQNSCMTQQA